MHSNRYVFATLALVFAFGCSKKDGKETNSESASPAVATGSKVTQTIDWDKKEPVNQANSPAAEPDVELTWPMPNMTNVVEGAVNFGKSSSGKIPQLWTELESYQSTFLKNWGDSFQAAETASAEDALTAFNELAYAVTGPSGFWRKTVHQNWFGCSNDAETPPCEKMKGLADELATWDKVQSKIEKLSPRKSKRFLAKNHKKIMAYLSMYVPKKASMTGMKETGFYKKHLAGVIDAN